MGDSEIIVPVHEIESWMDEALEVVDEGLDNLLAFMVSLNERTKQVHLELKRLEIFRRCFMAMNFFIVPVVVSILLCYGTRESFKSSIKGSQLETGFQFVVMFLMFFAGSVGFPLYLYSAWESYSLSIKMRKEFENSRPPCCEKESEVWDQAESWMTILTDESSLERVNSFARMLNKRMLDRMRADMERRTRYVEVIERGLSESGTIADRKGGISDGNIMMFKEAGKTNEETPESSAEYPPHLNDLVSKKSNFPILYEVQFRMQEQSPDLSIQIEPLNQRTTEQKHNEEVVESGQHLEPEEALKDTPDGEVVEGKDTV